MTNVVPMADRAAETLDDISRTEDAVALEFSAQHAHDLLWVQEWHRWRRWDGQRWVEDRTVQTMDQVRRLCRELAAGNAKAAKAMRQATFIAAVERLARTDRCHAAVPEQFDADPYVLNTPGGIVNLRTGQMGAAEPGAYCSKSTAAAPDGECRAWREFIERITLGDNELGAFLQRFAGYALTGDVREHALVFLYGTGANGKSTFLDTLAAMLGDYATTAAVDTFTATAADRHPADLAALRGARLVAAHETDAGRRWDEARIKMLTGGDPITARFMRGDFFTYQPSYKIAVVGNHRPQLRNVDEALRRRLHMIPFAAFIPPAERDPELPARLRAEAGGILRWAIEGCLAWQREGLRPPTAVTEATAAYLEVQDALAAWIEDCCEVRADKWDLPATLYERWRAWAEQAGEHPGNLRSFGDRLEAAGFRRAKANGVRQHRGLALRHDRDSRR